LRQHNQAAEAGIGRYQEPCAVVTTHLNHMAPQELEEKSSDDGRGKKFIETP